MKRGIVLVLGLILTLGFIGCDPNVEEPPKVIHPDYQGLFKLNNVEVYYRFTETHRILIENEQKYIMYEVIQLKIDYITWMGINKEVHFL